MKTRLRSGAFLAVAMLCSTLARPAPKASALSTLPIRIEPSAQKWLDATIAALGGKAFLGFKTLTSAGRVYFISNGATQGLFAYVSEMEYPDRRRLTLGLDKTGTGERITEWGTGDVGDLSISNVRITIINNRDQGWEIGRDGGVQDEPDRATRAWQVANRYSLANLLRVVIHEPGVLVQDGGTDFVDNVPVHALKIYDVHGGRVTLDVHQETKLPVRVEVRDLNRKAGSWQESEQDYSDYQPIQGIETPMHVTNLSSGRRTSEFYLEVAHYDKSYPATDFEVAQ